MVERRRAEQAMATALHAAQVLHKDAKGTLEHLRELGFEVVPAPGPGTRLYRLTDEQVRMTIGWLQVARDVALARGVDPVIAVLRAGLDDSEKEGT